MTGRQRLLSVLRGDPVDRVPVYSHVPFELSPWGMRPGPFHGSVDYDTWREQDPGYWKIVQRMEREGDNAFMWRPPCMAAEQFFIPPKMTRDLPERSVGEKVEVATEAEIGGATLRRVRAYKPGSGHSWEIEHYCKSTDDARRLLDIEWQGAPIEPLDLDDLEELLGDLGIMWFTIPSPIMAVCRLFDPMQFLMLSATERPLILRLMNTAQERIAIQLSALLDAGAGPVVRFGGAEHATPPMMSPDDFDELVVQFDRPLVDACKERGRFVAYHCHGNLRHALKRFREMRVDQIDPTEAEPDGDVTIQEAREIAGPDMVLAGNVQCREMFSASVGPSVIRERVRTFIQGAGPDRIIVTTTGTPLERMTSETVRNYHALFDAVQEYGQR